MGQLATLCSNFVEFQPGMIITLYTASGPVPFRGVQSLSFPEVEGRVVIQLVTPEGKFMFAEWLGIGCSMKSTSSDFQIKG